MNLKPEQYIQVFEKLKSNRTNWETNWQDIVDYFLPNRLDIIGQTTPGDKDTRKIYNSTPVRSAVKFAANLHSTLTNVNTLWSVYEMVDDELNKVKEVREWCDDNSKTMKTLLNTSNFHNQMHTFYLDVGTICTSVMYIEEDTDPNTDSVFVFDTRPIKEIFISENKFGRVDTVYRKIEMTARIIKERWEEDTPEAVTKAIEAQEGESPFMVLHVTQPRDKAKIKDKPLNSKEFPFESVWIFLEGGTGDTPELLKEGGYEEFPFAVVRSSKASGEVYGRGTGFDNLDDTKTLNSMVKSFLRAGARSAEPPYQAPDEGFIEGFDFSPNGMNYFDSSDTSGKNRIEIIPQGGQLPFTREMINDVKDDIKEGFYLTQLQLIDAREMTAEEVRTRTAENMRVISPLFGRLTSEGLAVIMFRCYAIAQRAGKLKEAPESVIGQELRVRYKSPIARAQQLHEAQAITQTVGTALGWAEIRPDVLDNIDFDAAIEEIGDLDGATSKIFNDETKIKEIRAARAAQQKQQIELEQANQKAEIVQKGSNAMKNMEGK